MYKFILAAFILLIYLIILYKKKGSFIYPSTLVVGLYFISAALSYPHIIVNDQTLSLNDEYFSSIFIFIILLFAFIYPFCSFKEHKIERIIIPGANLLRITAITIVLLSFISIIVLLPAAIRTFSYVNLSDARELGRQIEDGGLLVTIASTSSYLYSIAIILYFIYRAKGTNKVLANLLIISSLSYVIHVFTYAGRDGVVFWFFSFLASFGFFKKFLPEKDTKIEKVVLSLFIIIALPFFWAITRDRFSDNPFAGILSYIGQPLPNFALFYDADYPVSNGASFPLFRRIFGLEPIVNETVFYGGTNSYVFGTFLKSFITNVDIFVTLLIGTFMGLFFVRNFNRRNKSNFYFYQFFIYFLYFQIFSQGVFYFRLYSIAGNFFVILSFLLFYAFKISMKSENVSELVIDKCR
jgi:oligosaccharide repeat unit polymerase